MHKQARGRVHAARHANAPGKDLLRRHAGRGDSHAAHPYDGGRNLPDTAMGASRKSFPGQNSERIIHYGGDQVRTTNVNAKSERFHTPTKITRVPPHSGKASQNCNAGSLPGPG